jgi:hypothetical protein
MKVDGTEYHYGQAYGYLHKGKVKKLIEQGWESVNFTPAQVGGWSLKQGLYTLRRKVSANA